MFNNVGSCYNNPLSSSPYLPVLESNILIPPSQLGERVFVRRPPVHSNFGLSLSGTLTDDDPLTIEELMDLHESLEDKRCGRSEVLPADMTDEEFLAYLKR
jgi:hypothetical protein